MNKKIIRITEGDVRRIVNESVKRIVNEWSSLRPKPEIENIEFIDDGDVEDREVTVTLSNGTKIHIVPCYDSWEQYGGTEDELRITVPIANKCNRWLHGSGKRPLFRY